MRIGELAGQASVNVQTIRFYERQGLIREPARTSSGYRNYSPQDLERVKFIKWAQKLGFTLQEIRQLLVLHSAVATLATDRRKRKPEALQRIIRMAEMKLESVRERIQLLQEMSHEIQTMIGKLQCRPIPVCPGAGSSGTARRSSTSR